MGGNYRGANWIIPAPYRYVEKAQVHFLCLHRKAIMSKAIKEQ